MARGRLVERLVDGGEVLVAQRAQLVAQGDPLAAHRRARGGEQAVGDPAHRRGDDDRPLRAVVRDDGGDRAQLPPAAHRGPAELHDEAGLRTEG